MRNIIIIGFLIVLVVLVSGCTSSQSVPNSTVRQTTGTIGNNYIVTASPAPTMSSDTQDTEEYWTVINDGSTVALDYRSLPSFFGKKPNQTNQTAYRDFLISAAPLYQKYISDNKKFQADSAIYEKQLNKSSIRYTDTIGDAYNSNVSVINMVEDYNKMVTDYNVRYGSQYGNIDTISTKIW